MTEKHFCPRRGEAPHIASTIPDGDTWSDREGQRACSYCGSMHPDDLMAHLEAGTAEIGSTDKGYKIYVDVAHPDPEGERVYISQSHKPSDPENWLEITDENRAEYGYEPARRKTDVKTRWVKKGKNGPKLHAKFYFQHLSDQQRTRFVELLNEKKLKFQGGFGFYVLPYFITKS